VAFKGENGKLTEVLVEEVEWTKDETGRFNMKSTGKTETIKADLVFLALGFVHPVQEGLLTELGVKFDARGNVATDIENRSSIAKVLQPEMPLWEPVWLYAPLLPVAK